MNVASKTIDILYVEDNPDDVELTMRAMRKHNFVNFVHVVGDGEEALDFLYARGKYEQRSKLQRPKLVLLDLKLPKISGLEVLRQIKADPERKSIPIVVLTSSREDVDIEECYKLGVNSYIVKPVEFERFVQAVCDLGLYWLLLNEPPVAN
ncbi:MAG: response regulator [bacterium]|nr:response regulator [bacterium]